MKYWARLFLQFSSFKCKRADENVLNIVSHITLNNLDLYTNNVEMVCTIIIKPKRKGQRIYQTFGGVEDRCYKTFNKEIFFQECKWSSHTTWKHILFYLEKHDQFIELQLKTINCDSYMARVGTCDLSIRSYRMTESLSCGSFWV